MAYKNPLIPTKKEREPTYNLKAGQLQEIVRQGVLDGMAAGTYITNAMYSAAMLVVLHDKFGFGVERLNRVFTQVQDLFTECRDRDIEHSDLAQVLMDELGINLIIEKPDGVRQDALDLFRELEAPAKIQMHIRGK